MTDEDRLFVILKCNVVYDYDKLQRFYWRDPVGGHQTNKILLIERLINNEWVVMYEDPSLE